MSYTTVKNKNIKDKSVSIVTNPSPTDFVDDWVRNPSWLPLPTITNNMMLALYGVFPYSNYMALKITMVNAAHNYVIDWGDGVVETILSGNIAYHTYDYNTFDVSNSTLVTDNINGTYKQAIIKVTPEIVNGSISEIDATVSHNVGRLSPGYTNNLLDFSVIASSMSKIVLGGLSTTTTNRKLECITIGANALSLLVGAFANASSLRSISIQQSSYPSPLSFAYLFSGCRSLKTGLTYTGNVYSTQNMYDGCSALRYAPSVNITAAGSVASMFNGCGALDYAPELNLSFTTSVSLMFQNCYNLKNVPVYNTSNVTDFSGMFSACRRLENPPYLNTSSGTTFASMFSSCYDLQSVPHYNTSNATNTSAMFQSCNSLKTIPFFDLSKVTNTSSMFRYCYNLIQIPLFDLSKVTNTSYMFADCYSLDASQQFNLSLVTDASYMYQNTFSLDSVPSINLPAALNTLGMFSNSNLLYFPSLNIPNTTSCQSMFFGCKFTTVPDISIPANTSCTSMFSGCSKLVSVGNITTGTCTSYDSMFNGCTSLVDVGNIITTATSVTATSMFNGCASLKKIKNIFPAAARVSQSGTFAVSCSSLESLDNNTTLPWQNTISMSLPISLSSLKTPISSTSSFSVSGTKMNKESLEDFLQNYLQLPIASIVITNTPADVPPISFTSRVTTLGNATIPFTSTTGIQVGMQITGTGTSLTTPISVSYTTGTNIFTLSGFTFNADEIVSFTTAFGSFLANTYYYVVNPSGNTFQLAATVGGSPVSVGGTSSTALMRFFSFVQSIVPNTSVTLTKPCTLSNTSTLSFQVLKTGYALMKGATVSQ